MFTVSNAILTEIVYQVCMDLIGSFPASHDKCLFTRAPLRNFVWICMYVKPILSETSLCYCTKSIALATVMFTLGSDWVCYIFFGIRFLWSIQFPTTRNIPLFGYWILLITCKWSSVNLLMFINHVAFLSFVCISWIFFIEVGRGTCLAIGLTTSYETDP